MSKLFFSFVDGKGLNLISAKSIAKVLKCKDFLEITFLDGTSAILPKDKIDEFLFWIFNKKEEEEIE